MWRPRARDLHYAMQTLLSQSLRGMFDGPGNVRLDGDGLGVVLDLSALELTSPAMPLVLMTATGWMREFMLCPGRSASRSPRSSGSAPATATTSGTCSAARSSVAPSASRTSR